MNAASLPRLPAMPAIRNFGWDWLNAGRLWKVRRQRINLQGLRGANQSIGHSPSPNYPQPGDRFLRVQRRKSQRQRPRRARRRTVAATEPQRRRDEVDGVLGEATTGPGPKVTRPQVCFHGEFRRITGSGGARGTRSRATIGHNLRDELFSIQESRHIGNLVGDGTRTKERDRWPSSLWSASRDESRIVRLLR